MLYPKITGTLILTIYMVGLQILFDRSLYKILFQQSIVLSSSSTLLNSSVLTTSFLNVLSHSAVVLGFLNDNYVISILLGVGFDVMTRILQLVWWVHITTIMITKEEEEGHTEEREDEFLYRKTAGYILVLAIFYIHHMVIHLQALLVFPSSSAAEILSVLTSATNNIRGVPGEWYGDHIFAYSDLGWHLLLLILSYVLVQGQNALPTAFQILAMLMVVSYFALSKVPQNRVPEEVRENIIQIDENGKIACKCTTCKRKNIKCSFTFNINDGVCLLWLHSFEQLLNVLRSKGSLVGSKLD
mmetsp:Transcript_24380/g.36349  ORF Transcript_24380/g.36349 Transcript_24380/m.36349 type:complete len:300 (-) Transcript_24380:678-1577(-)